MPQREEAVVVGVLLKTMTRREEEAVVFDGVRKTTMSRCPNGRKHRRPREEIKPPPPPPPARRPPDAPSTKRPANPEFDGLSLQQVALPASDIDGAEESRARRRGQCSRLNLKRRRSSIMLLRRGAECLGGGDGGGASACRRPLLAALCLILAGRGGASKSEHVRHSAANHHPGEAGFRERGQQQQQRAYLNGVRSERPRPVLRRRLDGGDDDSEGSVDAQRWPVGKQQHGTMPRTDEFFADRSANRGRYAGTDRPSSRGTDTGTVSSTLRQLSSASGADMLLLRTNSHSFVVGLSTLLGCIVAFRLFLFFSVVHHRRQSTIQLAQPAVLAIFVLAGGAAAASCVLFLPLSDLRCRLREPFLLTALNLMAAVLVGRVWRIGVLMGPALLQIGQQDSRQGTARHLSSTGRDWTSPPQARESNLQELSTSALSCCLNTCTRSNITKQLEPVRQVVMDSLALLSDWGILCHCFVRIAATLFRCNSCLRSMERRDELRRKRKKESIRQAIPTGRLLWLIFVLMIPQMVLQVCNLLVPALVSSRFVHIYDEELMLGRYECARTPGMEWSSIVGILLAALPCAATAFLSLWSDGLPPVLNEAGAVKKSTVAFVMMTCVSAPTLVMTGDPDARAYLKTVIVLSLVLPPCWFLLISRIYNAWRREQKKTFHDLLRRERPSMDGRPSSNDMNADGNTNGMHTNASETQLRVAPANHAKTATLALTIGKMYENMGATSKCLNLFDEALDLWKVDPGRGHKELTGGFTEGEIDAFTSSDLDFIIQLLIAKGRVQGTYNSNKEKGIKNSAQAWVDAVDVYERASSTVALSDRAILFPVFSGLFVFLKGGKIKDDDNCTYAMDLVFKFARETRIYGDPVHYQRALAMQAEVYARSGRYQEALDTTNTLMDMYVPEEHSERMCSTYGTDHSVKCLSQSALWRVQLVEWDEAVDVCNSVISDLVPKMDPSNILGMTEILLPVIKILKGKGQAGRMRDLYNDHVVQACWKHLGKDAKTPAIPLFKPMSMLLDFCDEQRGERPALFPNVYECIDWILEGDNGVPPVFMDTVFTKVGYSPSSISAELCLRLSEQIGDCNPDKRKLLEKGLRLARDANAIISDDAGNVKVPIANDVNGPLLCELEERVKTLQEIDLTTGDDTDAARRASRETMRNIVTPKWLHKSGVTLKSMDVETVSLGSDELNDSKSSRRRRCSEENGYRKECSPFAESTNTMARSRSMCLLDRDLASFRQSSFRKPTNGNKRVSLCGPVTFVGTDEVQYTDSAASSPAKVCHSYNPCR